MLHKSFKTEKIEVLIYREKNRVKPGFEYYLLTLTKGMFGVWYENDTYKQKGSIYSEKKAFTIAHEIINNINI